MIWLLFCLLSSVMQAAFAETNRIYKVEPNALNFLHALFAAALIGFILPFAYYTSNWGFYVCAVISGIIISYGCKAQLDLAAKYSGRVSSMYIPFEAIVAFTVWSVMYPGSILWILSNQTHLVLLVLSFAIILVSFVSIRKNTVAWRNILSTMPIGIAYGLNAIIAKVALSDMPTQAVILYVFMNYIVIVLSMYMLCYRQKIGLKALFCKDLIRPGLLTGLFSAGSFICFILGVSFAHSPAYPTVISMLVPFWILIYHRCFRIPDNSSPIAGLCLILGVILFVLAVQPQ